MNKLHIDIETYSDLELSKSGLYKYANSEYFEILLFAYSLDNSPVQVIDLARGVELPDELIALLLSDNVVKHAFNATFEWYCITTWLKKRGLYNGTYEELLPQWRCTMFHSLYCGYPGNLDSVGNALKLAQDKRKLTQGKALIRIFCKPCKPTNKNGNRTRTFPAHEPDKWELFKDYCCRDVETEMVVYSHFSPWKVPECEQKQWEIEQVINLRGVKLDLELVEGAIQCSDIITNTLTEEGANISGLSNPNSSVQLKQWLSKTLNVDVPNVNKETISNLLQTVENPQIKRMLEIRQELAKTSVKKYEAMLHCAGEGDKARGLIQIYGANRTGRWAGRLIQIHNLPQNHLILLDKAREYVKNRDLEAIKLIYGNVPNTLSQLIRTAFIPSNKYFYVVDFSAIEARIVAWLAKEVWRLEVFTTHGKIYEASASAMFGVPLEKIVKGNPEYELRQKGKMAELALGYGGSSGALISIGALKSGCKEEELPDMVSRWRKSNKQIVELWYKLESSAIETVRTSRSTGVNGIIFNREYDPIHGLDYLTITLPSKRKLYYANPFLDKNRFGKDSLFYSEYNNGKWGVSDTYGGKLTENIVQAIARDCLAHSILKLHNFGLPIVFHVHDEVVIDMRENDIENIVEIMCEPIPWAEDLLLKAEGFTTDFYKKD